MNAPERIAGGLAVDAMQPTIIVENSGAAREAASVDVSRPRVAFGGGERPQFADETAEILRSPAGHAQPDNAVDHRRNR